MPSQGVPDGKGSVEENSRRFKVAPDGTLHRRVGGNRLISQREVHDPAVVNLSDRGRALDAAEQNPVDELGHLVAAATSDLDRFGAPPHRLCEAALDLGPYRPGHS